MKKLLITAFVAVAMVVGLAPAAYAGEKGEKGEKGEQGEKGEKGDNGADGKVTICHWANGHPHTITISVNALPGHFLVVEGEIGEPVPGHEKDSVGPCVKDGQDGNNGENGLTPKVLCAPGVGLGFTFNSEFEDSVDLYVLEDGAVCPLAGTNGTNGSNGTNGLNGADGSNGTNGTNGKDGLNGSAGADGVTNTYVGCSDGTVVGLGAKCPVETEVLGETITPTLTGELPRTGSVAGTIALIGGIVGGLGLILLLASAVIGRRRDSLVS